MPGSWSVPVSEQLKRDSFFRQVHLRFAMRYYLAWQNHAIIALHRRRSGDPHQQQHGIATRRRSSTATSSNGVQPLAPSSAMNNPGAMPQQVSNDSFFSTGNVSHPGARFGPLLSSPSEVSLSAEASPRHRTSSVDSTAFAAAAAFHVDQAVVDAERGIEALLQAGERIHRLERDVDVLLRENKEHAAANASLVEAVGEIEVHTVMLAEEASRAQIEASSERGLVDAAHALLSGVAQLSKTSVPRSVSLPRPPQCDRSTSPADRCPSPAAVEIDEHLLETAVNEATHRVAVELHGVHNAALASQLQGSETALRRLLSEWANQSFGKLHVDSLVAREAIGRRQLWDDAHNQALRLAGGLSSIARSAAIAAAVATRERDLNFMSSRDKADALRAANERADAAEEAVARLKRDLAGERHVAVTQRENLLHQVAFLKNKVTETESATLRREQLLTEQLGEATRQKALADARHAAALDDVRDARERADVATSRLERLLASPLPTLWCSCIATTELLARRYIVDAELEWRIVVVATALTEREHRLRIAAEREEAMDRAVDCANFTEFVEAQWRTVIFRIYKKFIGVAWDDAKALRELHAQLEQKRREEAEAAALQATLDELAHEIEQSRLAVAAEQEVEDNQQLTPTQSLPSTLSDPAQDGEDFSHHEEPRALLFVPPAMPTDESRWLETYEALLRIGIVEPQDRGRIALKAQKRLEALAFAFSDGARRTALKDVMRVRTTVEALECFTRHELQDAAQRSRLELSDSILRHAIEGEAFMERRVLRIAHGATLLTDLVNAECAARGALHDAYDLDSTALALVECHDAAIVFALSEWVSIQAAREFVFAQFRVDTAERLARAGLSELESEGRERLLDAADTLFHAVHRLTSLSVIGAAEHRNELHRSRSMALGAMHRTASTTAVLSAFLRWQRAAHAKAVYRAQLDFARRLIVKSSSEARRRQCFATWRAFADGRKAVRRSQSVIDALSAHSWRFRLSHSFRAWLERAVRSREQRAARGRWLLVQSRAAEALLRRLQKATALVCFTRWRVVAIRRVSAAHHLESSRAAAFHLVSQFTTKGRLRAYFATWLQHRYESLLRREVAAGDEARLQHASLRSLLLQAHQTHEVAVSAVLSAGLAMVQLVQAEAEQRVQTQHAEGAEWSHLQGYVALLVAEVECREIIWSQEAAAWMCNVALPLIEAGEDDAHRHFVSATASNIAAACAVMGDEAALEVESIVVTAERDCRHAISAVEDAMWAHLVDAAALSAVDGLTVDELRSRCVILRRESEMFDCICDAADTLELEVIPAAGHNERVLRDQKVALFASAAGSHHQIAALLALEDHERRNLVMLGEAAGWMAIAERHSTNQLVIEPRDPSLVRVHALREAPLGGMVTSVDLSPLELFPSPSSAHALPLRRASQPVVAGRPYYGLYVSNTMSHSSAPGVYVVAAVGDAAEIVAEGDFIVAVNGVPTQSVTQVMDAIPLRGSVVTRSDVMAGDADIDFDILRIAGPDLRETRRLTVQLTPTLDAPFPSLPFATLL